MTEAVVSNAGPLMVLAKLNLLHLLKQMYGRVQITSAVYQETVLEGLQQGYEDARTLRQFMLQEGWESTLPAVIPPLLESAALDRGEKESIALAISVNGMLLIDEERGREIARQQGLKVGGTLGVLIDAYRLGLIDAHQLRSYFQQIVMRTDIWISPTLTNRLLQELFGKTGATDASAYSE